MRPSFLSFSVNYSIHTILTNSGGDVSLFQWFQTSTYSLHKFGCLDTLTFGLQIYILLVSSILPLLTTYRNLNFDPWPTYIKFTLLKKNFVKESLQPSVVFKQMYWVNNIWKGILIFIDSLTISLLEKIKMIFRNFTNRIGRFLKRKC